MALIIAIVLIFIIGFKVFDERCASKEASQNRNEWEQALNKWRADITDERLEDKLELFIHNNPTDAAQMAKSYSSHLTVNLIQKNIMIYRTYRTLNY